jgi:hypothetical protein
MQFAIAGHRDNAFEIDVNIAGRSLYLRIGSRAMHAYLEDHALRPRSLPFYAHRRSEAGARVVHLGRLVVTID